MKKMMLIALVAVFALTGCKSHSKVIESGTYIDLSWEFTEDGVLTVDSTLTAYSVLTVDGVREREIPYLDKSVRTLPWHQYTDAIKSIVIKDGITSIGSGVFSEFPSLISVTIGNGVTSISVGAFADCPALTNVTIGSGVTSIGIAAFADCPALRNVTILATVPPITDHFCFLAQAADLYVPSGCVDSYEDSVWRIYFKTINEQK